MVGHLAAMCMPVASELTTHWTVNGWIPREEYSVVVYPQDKFMLMRELDVGE
jgi:hypothetical protein